MQREAGGDRIPDAQGHPLPSRPLTVSFLPQATSLKEIFIAR